MRAAIITVFVLVIITVSCDAQNWAPVNESERFNYGSEGSHQISAVIFSTERYDDGANEVFLLNRVVKSCDTCQQTIADHLAPFDGQLLGTDPGLGMVMTDCGQFMGKRIVHTPEDEWLFYDDDFLFMLKPKLLNGDEWVANEEINLMAVITQSIEQELWGEVDSLKTISFSDGRTVILSKDHGLIRYQDAEVGWTLLGIEGRDLGERLPGLNEFFDLNEGDVFEYEGRRDTTWKYGWYEYYHTAKWTEKRIISNVEIDGLIVHVQGTRLLNMITGPAGTGGEGTIISTEPFSIYYNLTVNMSEKPYPGKLMGYDYYDSSNNEWRFFPQGIAEYVMMGDRYILRLGEVNPLDLFPLHLPMITERCECTPELPDGLFPSEETEYSELEDYSECCFLSGGFKQYGYSYGVGLGQMDSLHNWWSGGHHGGWSKRKMLNMTGAVINGDTLGVITPDDVLLGVGRTVSESPAVYPTLTSGRCTLSHFSPTGGNVEAYDLSGRLRLSHVFNAERTELDLSTLPDGIYILNMRAADGRPYVTKVLKVAGQ